MTKDQISEQAEKVKLLSGKTISHGTCEEWGIGHSIRIYFSDGSIFLIYPEYDEGFMFEI